MLFALKKVLSALLLPLHELLAALSIRASMPQIEADFGFGTLGGNE